VVSRTEVAWEAGSAHVWTAGQGEPVVLLHGAWSGAQFHWASVWDALAEHVRVVAPDLPGLADDTQPAPRSFDDAAAWVEQLLDAMDIESAWLVGNSFGAAVAWRTAAREPTRCRGLALVNGAPPPDLPRAVRALATRGPLRWIIDGLFRRNAYSSSTIRRAFADPTRAPTELQQLVRQRRPRQFDLTSNMVFAGGPVLPAPSMPTLLLWGADDHLMGTNITAAKRLLRSVPNGQLVVIPGAGHLPQLEKPHEVVAALTDFIPGRPDAPRS
jgi:pimeloyl-ACP methyl ester carboxylesterase